MWCAITLQENKRLFTSRTPKFFSKETTMLSPLCSSHRPFIVTRERSKGNGSYKLVSVIFIVGAADRKFPHAVNFKH